MSLFLNWADAIPFIQMNLISWLKGHKKLLSYDLSLNYLHSLDFTSLRLGELLKILLDIKVQNEKDSSQIFSKFNLNM